MQVYFCAIEGISFKRFGLDTSKKQLVHLIVIEF